MEEVKFVEPLPYRGNTARTSAASVLWGSPCCPLWYYRFRPEPRHTPGTFLSHATKPELGFRRRNDWSLSPVGTADRTQNLGTVGISWSLDSTCASGSFLHPLGLTHEKCLLSVQDAGHNHTQLLNVSPLHRKGQPHLRLLRHSSVVRELHPQLQRKGDLSVCLSINPFFMREFATVI